ncbi:MAG: hypothetical protein AAGJ87_05860 [Pseudomonadota bacterium]
MIMVRRLVSVIAFDMRAVLRDQFMYLLLLIIGVLYGLFAGVGMNREALGVAGLTQWIPYVLILSIITNPSSFGLLFGFLLIEEVETKVRAALMTTPVPPLALLAMRTPLTIVVLTATALLLVASLNAAWGRPVALAFHQWLALAVSAAFIGAAVMISISTLASDRVAALALGKFYSGLTAPPALLYLAPPDAWWRPLFLFFPTTPIVKAYDSFRAGASAAAWAWLAFGVLYVGVLTAFAARRYLRKSYAIA